MDDYQRTTTGEHALNPKWVNPLIALALEGDLTHFQEALLTAVVTTHLGAGMAMDNLADQALQEGEMASLLSEAYAEGAKLVAGGFGNEVLHLLYDYVYGHDIDLKRHREENLRNIVTDWTHGDPNPPVIIIPFKERT